MKHLFQSMNDKFNGNTEKMCPPPHLTGHEVYEIVNDVHDILGKQKRTSKNTSEDDIWKIGPAKFSESIRQFPRMARTIYACLF
jgi:hypothetical protein